MDCPACKALSPDAAVACVRCGATLPPPPPPPGPWLVRLWAASRAAWIAPLGLWALVGVLGSLVALARGQGMAALHGLLASGFLALFWIAARHTWLIVRGKKVATKSALAWELGGNVLFLSFFVLCAAIAAPAFLPLFRKSAEGEMKGHLAMLRLATKNYEQKHGRPPRSLPELASGAGEIPVLWPRFSGVPHHRNNALVVTDGRTASDSGRWTFVVSVDSPPLNGTIFIDCTHTDTRGNAWNSY